MPTPISPRLNMMSGRIVGECAVAVRVTISRLPAVSETMPASAMTR